MDTREIVVGTEGSACATIAVRWAAEEAALRGAPLRVLLAHDTEWPGLRFGGEPGLYKLADDQAEAILESAVRAARQVDENLEIRTQRVVGLALPALLSAGEGAGMLVVGSRGHGGFASLLLGSVSQEVACRAPCSVAVIRDARETGPVVVGSDGSDQARGAVEVAFQLAAERRAPLLAVRAYYPPTLPFGFGYQALTYSLDVLDQTAQAELAGELEPWREKHPAVDVRAAIAHGGAAGALVERSSNARLVVIGSRGHGAVTGAMLGSVGLQLLHHATCPVVWTHEGSHR
ncbi:universal stress protein [Asanoa sp. NPDC049573]|uniref:universal stress protein n=1 Tax=Asanoa sp. NPDC049573 TaxID=3155396 RepID=UPI00344331BA